MFTVAYSCLEDISLTSRPGQKVGSTIVNTAKGNPHLQDHPKAKVMPSNMWSRPPAFRCSICEDDYLGFVSIDVAGYRTCRDCFDSGIRPQFEAALLSEQSYPPKVGTTKLEIDQYADFFSPEFVSGYRKKAKEFDIPPKLRVYCADCGLFLDNATGQRRTSTCEGCLRKTCLRCRFLVYLIDLVPLRLGRPTLLAGSSTPLTTRTCYRQAHEARSGKSVQAETVARSSICGKAATMSLVLYLPAGRSSATFVAGVPTAVEGPTGMLQDHARRMGIRMIKIRIALRCPK